MNTAKAKRYVLSANGNAFVAAWISVLDEYKLPANTDLPPDEWYQAFEELHLSNAIDPDVFGQCDVRRTFYSGEKPSTKLLDSAFWNLKYLRSIHQGEAADNEEYVMKPESRNEVCPDFGEMIEGGGHPNALSRILEPGPRSLSLDGRGFSGSTELSMPDMPSLPGDLVERRGSEEIQCEIGGVFGDTPERDVRGLECQSPAAQSFGKPYTEMVNFSVTCCDDVLYLEDTGGGDFVEADDNEDHDLLDLQLHGQCPRCKTVFHMGAAMPLPKGSLGNMY